MPTVTCATQYSASRIADLCRRPWISDRLAVAACDVPPSPRHQWRIAWSHRVGYRVHRHWSATATRL